MYVYGYMYIFIYIYIYMHLDITSCSFFKSAMTELPWSSVELLPSHESYVYGADVYMCMHTYLHIMYYTHTHMYIYIYIYGYIYI